jgi:hypothetical protein
VKQRGELQRQPVPRIPQKASLRPLLPLLPLRLLLLPPVLPECST